MDQSSINNKRCQNHTDIEADYQFWKKGTKDSIYICIDCYDSFPYNFNDYSITEISTKNINNLEAKIDDIIADTKQFKLEISKLILNINETFKKMVEKTAKSLIKLIESSANKFYKKFDNFSNSNFITNYDGYIKEMESLKNLFNDQGKGFSDECYKIRKYINLNIDNLDDFSQKCFEKHKNELRNAKISEELVSEQGLLLENEAIFLKIFEKELNSTTNFLMGKNNTFSGFSTLALSY